MKTNQIIEGGARSRLSELADDSVDCVITSPPYFQLRNYGHEEQIGLETSVDGWVNQLKAVFDELARLLKPTGSVWLNLGDSYSRHPKSGAPAKSLLLAPERLLLALSEDGWIVRNKVIWAKTNPMPASVTDRLATGHEYLYFLTRQPRYFFDLDAIRTRHKTTNTKRSSKDAYPPPQAAPPTWAGPLAGNNAGLSNLKRSGRVGHPLGKNPGDVWHLPTASFHGAHFATFPERLVTRPLLATCPEKTCSRCGRPWNRTKERTIGHLAVAGKLTPTCDCGANATPGVVLDPFFGAGTVGVVAEAHKRHWIGIEINAEYSQLAMERITSARQKRSTEQSKDQQKIRPTADGTSVPREEAA